MKNFEVIEAADGWHVRLTSGAVDQVFKNREEAIAYSQAFVHDGASHARSEIEQGDTPLPRITRNPSGRPPGR
jgi:hypothetical protein